MAKLEQQMLHDFAMDKIFTPENAKTGSGLADQMLAEEPLFKKGEKVRFINKLRRPERKDDHEIVGFYHGGQVVDENHASPYNKSYSVRIRNTRTGQEYPVVAHEIQRIQQEPEEK